MVFRLVVLDEHEEYIKLVAPRATTLCSPETINGLQSPVVICLGPDRLNLHLIVSASISSYCLCVPMNFTKPLFEHRIDLKPESHWAAVDQADLHVGTEFPRLQFRHFSPRRSHQPVEQA